VELWAIASCKSFDCEGRGQDLGLARLWAVDRAVVAVGVDFAQGGARDEVGGVVPDDRAGGQCIDVGGEAAVFGCSRDDTGMMERVVEVLGAAGVVKRIQEGPVVGAAAERAGAVACGEGDGFVEEEQLGVVARLHDLTVPVLVSQQAGDPGFVAPAGAAQGLRVVMQNAAIAHEQTPGGMFDEVAGGEDAVLVWHGGVSLAGPPGCGKCEERLRSGRRRRDTFREQL